ncbi:MAG: diguanylate cyclase [Acetivibrio sp.]
MTLEQEAINFIDCLQKQYFEESNVEIMISKLSKRVSWIGTGHTEVLYNVEKMSEALFCERKKYPEKFTIIKFDYSAQRIEKESCIVFGKVYLISKNPEISDFYIRVTAVCKKEKGTMKLLHIHTSCPDNDQETLNLHMKETTTKLVTSNNQLQLSIERYKIIMDQATDILFEWDISKDTLEVSANWRKKFGYAVADKNITRYVLNSSNINTEDRIILTKIIKDTLAGVPYSEVEIRIRDIFEKYIWCRIRVTTQFNTEGKPVRAVGVILDIDEEKRQKLLLQEQAQRDALTGLYNKNVVRLLIEDKIKTTGEEFFQALMIIDLDNFKKVNDTYGHLSGDIVLSDIAEVLKRQFPTTDIVGRIGGDEFLVFLPQIEEELWVQNKAVSLLHSLKKVHPNASEEGIECSIGIAFSIAGKTDYYTLFQHADQALYQIKGSGKNRVGIYDSSKSE